MTDPPRAAARGHDDIAVARQTLAAHDAPAAQVADAMVATWHEIDAALTPIIGSKAVVALYKRSLYLTARTHPWLAGTHEGAQALDLAALKPVVARQSSAEAALGSRALLQTFDRLLGSLIGPSLTERLLRSAGPDALSGPPQDTPR
jgi:hypothetical protein